MSIFKVAVAVLEARTANMAEAKARKAKAHEEYLKNLNPYDKNIVGHETSLSDGFTLELRKQPMGYCELPPFSKARSGAEVLHRFSPVWFYNGAFRRITCLRQQP